MRVEVVSSVAMGDGVHLVRPAVELRREYLSFYEEWAASGERMVPWVITRDPSDFEDVVRFLLNNEIAAPDGGVPNSTYWLVTQDRQVVGVSNLRHRLNDRLLRSGGHIGYGIRPSERRKGYATKLLSLTLEKANALGLTSVLLCCDEGNVGSERTIRNNGGTPDQRGVDDNGKTVLRFWIDL